MFGFSLDWLRNALRRWLGVESDGMTIRFLRDEYDRQRAVLEQTAQQLHDARARLTNLEEFVRKQTDRNALKPAVMVDWDLASMQALQNFKDGEI